MTERQIDFEAHVYLNFRTPRFRDRITFNDFLIARLGENYFRPTGERSRIPTAEIGAIAVIELTEVIQ